MIIRTEKNSHYTTIANYALNDPKLSLKAKGLWAFIMSKPDDWNINYRGLSSQLKEGKAAILAALKELEDAKYLIRGQVRNDVGKFSTTSSTLYEEPCTENRSTENRCTDNQRTKLSTNKLSTEQDFDISKGFLPVDNASWESYTDEFGVYSYARRDKQGYVILSKFEKPRIGANDTISRHRWVYQNTQGSIPVGYHVNHINRVRGDDRPENLEALSPADHQKKHWVEEKAGLAPRRKVGSSKAKNIDGTYGKSEINELFNYWTSTTGFAIKSNVGRNRQACYRLFNAYGIEEAKRMIDVAAKAQQSQYAPAVGDFVALASRQNDLRVWQQRNAPAPAVNVGALLHPQKYGNRLAVGV